MISQVDIDYRKKLLRHNIVNSYFDKSIMNQFYEVVDEFFFGKTKFKAEYRKSNIKPEEYLSWLTKNEYLAGEINSNSGLNSFPFECLNIDGRVADLLIEQKIKFKKQNKDKVINQRKISTNSRRFSSEENFYSFISDDSNDSYYDVRSSYIDDIDKSFDFRASEALLDYLAGSRSWFLIKISQATDVVISRLNQNNLWNPYLLSNHMAIAHINSLVNNCIVYTVRRFKDNCLLDKDSRSCGIQLDLITRVWNLISNTILERTKKINNDSVKKLLNSDDKKFDNIFMTLMSNAKMDQENFLKNITKQRINLKHGESIYGHHRINDKILNIKSNIANGYCNAYNNYVNIIYRSRRLDVLKNKSTVLTLRSDQLLLSAWVLEKQFSIDNFMLDIPYYSGKAAIDIGKKVVKTGYSLGGVGGAIVSAGAGVYATEYAIGAMLGLSLGGAALTAAGTLFIANYTLKKGLKYYHDYKNEKIQKDIDIATVKLKELEERRRNFRTQLVMYHELTSPGSTVTNLLRTLDHNKEELYASLHLEEKDKKLEKDKQSLKEKCEKSKKEIDTRF